MKHLFQEVIVFSFVIGLTFLCGCGLAGDVYENHYTEIPEIVETPKETVEIVEPLPAATVHILSGAGQCVAPGEQMEMFTFRVEDETGAPVSRNEVVFTAGDELLDSQEEPTHLKKWTNSAGEVSVSVRVDKEMRLRRPGTLHVDARGATAMVQYMIMPPSLQVLNDTVVGSLVEVVGDEYIYEYSYSLVAVEPCGRVPRHRRVDFKAHRWIPQERSPERPLGHVLTEADGTAEVTVRLPTIDGDSWVNVLEASMVGADPIDMIGCWWSISCDLYRESQL